MTLQSGTRLGSYEIVSLLGSGGMGEVYRAKDHKLGRDVAIKVLREELATDPERLRRFEQEARSASALNHPNIITIYDIGKHGATPYIAMEYVEGKTLREMVPEGPVPTKKLLHLAGQIAEGLAKAHSAGIVHRDLKPENLMISSDGYLKILDFGLAKLMPESVDARSEMLTLTKESTSPGAVVGTVGYMSPEQASGRKADYRSDQFSFGLILYEIATGRSPFRRDTVAETLTAIIREEPEPIAKVNPNLPAPLRWIVERCLAKDPEERYVSTSDLAKELQDLRDHLSEVPSAPTGVPPLRLRILTRKRWLVSTGLLAAVLALVIGLNVGGLRNRLLGTSSPGPIESLAVLPLENLSGDPEQEYFADGMTEALIIDLAQIGALKVISRTTAFRLKDTDKSLPEIAQELNVEGIVEGSVLRSGDRIRITAQLIHAATDQHLWARSYERDLRDILSLQSEVAKAIAREIRITVTPEEEARLARARPVNPEAHEAYLMGRYHREKLTPADLKQAVHYFQQAIDKDPDFALPYAYLANTFLLAGGGFGPLFSPQESLQEARAIVDKALEIDPELSEAYSSLGHLLSRSLDWNGAVKAFRQAIAINPGSAQAHHLYAVHLTKVGRHEDALAEIRRALDLDPLNLFDKSVYGMLLYHARQYNSAIQQLQTTLALDPDYAPAHRFLGLTYLAKNMYEEAIFEHQQAVTFAGENSLNDLSFLGGAYAAAGRRDEAMKILKDLESRSAGGPFVDPFNIGYIYSMLGDVDEAMSCFERSINEHNAMVAWLKVFPALDPLRDDPRFQNLLRRMNFPE